MQIPIFTPAGVVHPCVTCVIHTTKPSLLFCVQQQLRADLLLSLPLLHSLKSHPVVIAAKAAQWKAKAISKKSSSINYPLVDWLREFFYIPEDTQGRKAPG